MSAEPVVVICRPDETFLRRHLRWCPVEEAYTPFVVRHEAWYGDTHMCCGCGDAWNDGERLPRPFKRGWRQEAIRSHWETWQRATYGPPPSYDDFVEAGLL